MIIDGVQANINFDTTGTVTSDLTAKVQTKNELGEAYGMKAASGIGKEWNEQAAAFASYVTGKTLDEAMGIAVTEEGKAADIGIACCGNKKYVIFKDGEILKRTDLNNLLTDFEEEIKKM